MNCIVCRFVKLQKETRGQISELVKTFDTSQNIKVDEIEILKNKNICLVAELAVSTKDIDDLRKKHNQFQEEVDELKESLNVKTDELKSLKISNLQLADDLTVLTSAARGLTEKYNAILEKCNCLESELKLTVSTEGNLTEKNNVVLEMMRNQFQEEIYGLKESLNVKTDECESLKISNLKLVDDLTVLKSAAKESLNVKTDELKSLKISNLKLADDLTVLTSAASGLTEKYNDILEKCNCLESELVKLTVSTEGNLTEKNNVVLEMMRNQFQEEIYGLKESLNVKTDEFESLKTSNLKKVAVVELVASTKAADDLTERNNVLKIIQHRFQDEVNKGGESKFPGPELSTKRVRFQFESDDNDDMIGGFDDGGNDGDVSSYDNGLFGLTDNLFDDSKAIDLFSTLISPQKEEKKDIFEEDSKEESGLRSPEVKKKENKKNLKKTKATTNIKPRQNQESELLDFTTIHQNHSPSQTTPPIKKKKIQVDGMRFVPIDAFVKYMETGEL